MLQLPIYKITTIIHNILNFLIYDNICLYILFLDFHLYGNLISKIYHVIKLENPK